MCKEFLQPTRYIKWAKALNRCVFTEDVQMTNRHVENPQHPALLGKYTSNPRVTCLLEWQVYILNKARK